MASYVVPGYVRIGTRWWIGESGDGDGEPSVSGDESVVDSVVGDESVDVESCEEPLS